MWISRIRVTGGFLNGLDLSLTDGLNVVIGPRGSGKTTLLELLRHGLGAEHADQGSARKRQAFLDAVLGTGEVIIDVESDDGGRHLVVDAKGGGQRADLSRSVMVLGQSELEEIASDGPSRLNLLDLRMGVVASAPDRGAAATLTGELFDVRADLERRREESQKRSRLVADRDLFASQETALLGGSSGRLVEQREQLRLAEESVIQSGQDMEKVADVRQDLEALATSQDAQSRRLDDLAARARTLPGPDEVQVGLVEATRLSTSIVQLLGVLTGRLDGSASEARERNLSARELSAPIREALEQAETGLGQITSQLRNVDAELRSLDENDAAITRLEAQASELDARRAANLDSAERAEEELYAARAEIARSTTAQIANNVVVVVEHLSNFEEFKAFLHTALRGSSTRTAMIDTVAERVLPRQLLEIVENRDATGLSAVTDLAPDRAQRLIENLDRKGVLEGLAEVGLTDSVDFRLRDGSVDKSVDLLSTGQKCAVTLPIILSEQERTLILDQPEDHLDNAYLVKNVVGGLVSRSLNGAQTIVATHNANIPVLGSAENVVVLMSDGVRGSVSLRGEYRQDDVVETITGLMEGGREAFARRSAFYAEHWGQD